MITKKPSSLKSIEALRARTAVKFEGAGFEQPKVMSSLSCSSFVHILYTHEIASHLALGATPQIALEGSITSLCLSQVLSF